MARTASSAIALAACLTLASCAAGGDGGVPDSPAPASGPAVSGASPGTGPAEGQADAEPQVIASGLQVPWGLAFLPDRSALVTLRDSGRVLRIPAGGGEPTDLGAVPGVVPGGEGGLLGVAVSPGFADDGRVFVYFTAADDNRVLRMTLRGDTLAADRVVLSGIPKAQIHNGGRIAFGPDRMLYVATGDAGDTENAQDPAALGGKILRLTADGGPASGNPTSGSPVWSLGHRNVQGLAWDADDRMWAAEFGQNTFDELNHIEPGRNYGWPQVEGYGDTQGGRFTNPVAQWDTAEASPSGLAIGPDGAAYLAALRGERLWRVPLSGGQRSGEPQSLLEGEYGRLRSVALAPDGRMWIVTSNTFRGDPGEDDDRVVSLPVPG